MKKTAILLASVMALTGTAIAHDLGIGGALGTDGIGIEAKYTLRENVQLRGSLTTLKYDQDVEVDNIDYNGELDFTNVGAFVDFFPFEGNGFNVSAGAYLGDKKVDLSATSANDVTIGGNTYTPEEIGTLNGEAKLEDFAPYLGIGYDNFRSRDDISFNVRAGIMFSGSPEISLTSATGAVAAADIDTEIQAIEDDLEDFEFYPVLSVGVTKRF